uniref:Uncharacterized protein n=1 Tax=Arundo donax TaxID=35708 RepID=A0A0A9BBJ2_ARUDO
MATVTEPMLLVKNMYSHQILSTSRDLLLKCYG